MINFKRCCAIATTMVLLFLLTDYYYVMFNVTATAGAVEASTVVEVAYNEVGLFYNESIVGHGSAADPFGSRCSQYACVFRLRISC